jgi:hypothetical protein
MGVHPMGVHLIGVHLIAYISWVCISWACISQALAPTVLIYRHRGVSLEVDRRIPGSRGVTTFLKTTILNPPPSYFPPPLLRWRFRRIDYSD